MQNVHTPHILISYSVYIATYIHSTFPNSSLTKECHSKSMAITTWIAYFPQIHQLFFTTNNTVFNAAILFNLSAYN